MNKLEFQKKLDECVDLARKGQYQEAVGIAEDLRFDGVRDTRILQDIAGAYEKCKMYEDAEYLLLRAKESAPKSRGILYSLCTVAIAQGNLGDADKYYRQFSELARDDSRQYVLEYLIARAAKEPDEKLIAILEKFKNADPDDRWLLELARLYAMNGKTEAAVEICDQISLWFFNGKYVQIAKKLRALLTGEEVPEEEPEPAPAEEEQKEPAEEEPETVEETPETPAETAEAPEPEAVIDMESWESDGTGEEAQESTAEMPEEPVRMPEEAFETTEEPAEVAAEPTEEPEEKPAEETVEEPIKEPAEEPVKRQKNSFWNLARVLAALAEVPATEDRPTKEELFRVVPEEEPETEIIEKEPEKEPAEEEPLIFTEESEKAPAEADSERVFFPEAPRKNEYEAPRFETEPAEKTPDREETDDGFDLGELNRFTSEVFRQERIRPIAEEKQEEAFQPAEEEPVAEAEPTAEPEFVAEAEPTAEPEFVAESEPAVEPETTAETETASEEEEHQIYVITEQKSRETESEPEAKEEREEVFETAEFSETEPEPVQEPEKGEEASLRPEDVFWGTPEPEKEPEPEEAPAAEFEEEESVKEEMSAELPKEREIFVDPETPDGLWHIMVQAGNDEVALETAKKRLREIEYANGAGNLKMTRLPADRICGISIADTLEQFKGRATVIEGVDKLSDEQLGELAFLLEIPDPSIQICLTGTKEAVAEAYRRVPDLKKAFTAVFNEDTSDVDALLSIVKAELKAADAHFDEDGETAAKAYIHDVLRREEEPAAKAKEFADRILKVADKTGFFQIFRNKQIDKDGNLTVMEKDVRKAIG